MKHESKDRFSAAFPHAFVHPDACVPASTLIGIGVCIGPTVVLGESNVICDGVSIRGQVHMGDRNYIGSHVTIGGFSRQRIRPSPWDEGGLTGGSIEIGSDCLVFEHANIHSPMRGVTKLSNWVSIGAYCQIAHDVKLGSYVTIAAHSAIGGYCIVGSFGNLGLHVALYPRIVVGSLGMVGMKAAVLHHVPPGTVVVGCPARYLKANLRGMERAGFTDDERADLMSIIEGQTLSQTARVREILSEFDEAVESSRSTRKILMTGNKATNG